MEKLRRLAQRTAELNANEILHEVFEDRLLQAQILDRNVEQMYEEGKGAEGQSLGEYAPITISYYKPLAGAEGRDSRVDHVTLRDTGEFHHSFDFRNENDGFILIADTLKPGLDLQDIYGKLIGLDPKNQEWLIETIKPDVLTSTRQTITDIQ